MRDLAGALDGLFQGDALLAQPVGDVHQQDAGLDLYADHGDEADAGGEGAPNRPISCPS